MPLQFIMPQGGGLPCHLAVDPVVMVPLAVPPSGVAKLELALPGVFHLGQQSSSSLSSSFCSKNNCSGAVTQSRPKVKGVASSRSPNNSQLHSVSGS
jgi:hypothetical protein